MTRRVPHPDAPGLEACVAEPAAFVADTLFRRYQLRSGGQAGDLASADALWDDALTRGVRAPSFRMVRGGTTLSMVSRRAGVGHRTIADVIQPNRVLQLYADGATMVLQGLQFTDPHLAKVANNLALALGHPVQVNAYLSPPSARGLELHFDYHDVFVLQLEGSKRWRVWEPLVRTRDPIRSVPKPAAPTLPELGPAPLDVTLRQGDCLYLPRGHPHAAETVDDASAHLTIGILSITWRHVLRSALDAAVADGAWRGSVPAGTPALAAELQHLLTDVAASLAPRLDVSAVRRWMAMEVWRRQPATRLRPRDPPMLDIRRPVALTPGPLLWLDLVDGQATLGLGDRQLSMPAEGHEFLAELLRAPGPIDPADLDVDLDNGSREAVVRRLGIEGVIEPA